MPLPTLEDVTVTTGTGTGAQNVNYPGTVNDGELLVTIFTADANETGDTTITPGADMTQFGEQEDSGLGNGVSVNVSYRDADGTETGTFTMTLNQSEAWVGAVFRFSNWDGVTAPDVSAFTGVTNAANPDPVALTGLTEDDYVGLVCYARYGQAGADAVTGWPTGFTEDGEWETGTGTADAHLSVASGDFETVTSIDPGALTVAADYGYTFTIAVRGGAPGGRPPHIFEMAVG